MIWRLKRLPWGHLILDTILLLGLLIGSSNLLAPK